MILLDKYAMSGNRSTRRNYFQACRRSLAHLKDNGHTLAIITSKPEAPLLHLLDSMMSGISFRPTAP